MTTLIVAFLMAPPLLPDDAAAPTVPPVVVRQEGWEVPRAAWGEGRHAFRDDGIAFEAVLVHDLFRVVSGGARRGTGRPRMLDASLEIDLGRTLGLEGGTAFLEWYATGGQGISAVAGDLQGASNIESERENVLAELWWEQQFPDAGLRLKLGKVDANTEFAGVEHGADFLHSSMGFSPTIFVLPTFPDPAFSANLEWHPCDPVSLRLGVYDGAAQQGVSTGTHGPSTFLGKPSDLFLIGEADLSWDAGGGGRLGLGRWEHTGAFDRFDGGEDDGAAGAFLVLDQNVWRGNGRGAADERIDVFFQWGKADGDVSEVESHLGAGVLWSGFREGQRIGVAASRAGFSDEPGAGFTEDHELAVETFWRWEVTSALAIQPDVQFVVHPGGDENVNDALLVGCRVEWRFGAGAAESDF